MKINLSKEHIKKGCKLVKQYSYFKDDSVRGDFNYHLRHINSRLDIETMVDSPFYRDFLHLVIEGINRELEDNYCSYYIIQRPNRIQLKRYSVTHDIPDEHISFKDYRSNTEAKEKAIAYVFDNMEV